MKIVNLIVLWILMGSSGTIEGEVLDVDSLHNWINTPVMPVIEAREVIEEEEVGDYNEMGQVPILVYHRIKTSNEDYDISAESFRNNLQKLYDNNFVLTDFVDYLNGKIEVPKGKHPVVMTFDDGTLSQFNLIEAGEGDYKIDPDSAMGMLYEFYLQHPEFGFEATFFLNGHAPFGQRELAEDKIEFMLENGLRIGNHTINHVNFSLMNSPEEVLNAVKSNEIYFLDNYGIEMEKIIALPFGAYPKEFSSIETLNYPTLKVGWKPEVSVFSKSFDPLRLNRVQNGEKDFQFEYWIDDLIGHPEKVFTSDGNSEKITVPAELVDQIDPKWLEQMDLAIREVK
jgi:peptidoglycan/xylan/chitin deacetylase (PgdA/CDA1 family)